MEFSDRLKFAMAGANLNQKQLADRVRVGQPTVSQWVNGQRIPSDNDTVVRLMTTLGATREWLMEGSGSSPASARRKSLNDILGEVNWVAREAPPDGGRDGGNANQFAIRPSIASLVREAIQNSVDEALGKTFGPVRVRFRLLSFRGKGKQRFLAAMHWDQLRPHVEASIAQSRDQQIAGGLHEALDMADSGDLLVLQIIDGNTRGLIGPERGEGNFAALTRDNLFSEKQSDAAGGSYGLGKAMQYAASAFGTVLFLSDLSEPEPDEGETAGRFIGRSELVYHDHDGLGEEACAGPLWFGRDPEGRRMPVSYWSEGKHDAMISDLQMTREDGVPGTTIAIVGLRDLDTEQTRPPRAIAEQIAAETEREFWPAIEAGSLEVRVDYAEIEDPDVTPVPELDVLVTPGASKDVAPLVAAFRSWRAGECVESLIDGGDVVATSADLRVPSRKTGDDQHAAFTHPAVVLVRRAALDEAIDDASGRTLRTAALFRGANMVVKTLDLARAAVGAHPFQVVVLAGLAAGSDENARRAEEFLRAAEPPSHDDWMYTPRLRQRYVQGGKKALADFEMEIRRVVHDVVSIESEEESDGPRDLARRFRFGEPAKPERAPSVPLASWVVNDAGSWVIEGAVRQKGDLRRAVAGRVRLEFVGESGGASAVKWLEMSAIGDGVRVADDGQTLIISPQTRTAKFRGVSDPASHPAPAAESVVRVVFRPTRVEV